MGVRPVQDGFDLGDMYTAMDDAVRDRAADEEFVTCVLGRLHIVTGELLLLNGGHPLPMIVRNHELVLTLQCEPSLPPGLGDADQVPAVPAEILHFTMQPGDRVCCVTDGVVDAHRPGGSDFGEARVEAFLAAGDNRWDAMETVRRLTHTVLDHHGYLSDDASVFLVEFRSP